ncbi:MAG TPA: GTPase HflX [Thermoanaerobaculia bacterium]|nr:GTPase HflX [Thermoanaerobaculia bacterium]
MEPLTPPPESHRRRALIVGLALPGRSAWEVDDHLDELAALADTAGADVVDRAVQSRRAPDPRLYLGGGKAEALAAEAKKNRIDLVLVDDDLSGSQARNLEQALGVEVLDRSGLILRIFDRRARSREARTQVELARLRYELPRLARRWGHLSRQAGGIGVRGGEGETQLEADRRMLRRRIAQLERDLAKIERMRKVQRRGRRGTPVIALAGYTNAGKSTLFNQLTHDGTLAEDRLFATLDSRLRRGSLRSGAGGAVIFADTVGFIRKLPHHLVASFRSTLDEVVEADLVLHVVDRSHPRWEEQQRVAEEVLEELGVDPRRILLVANKVDRLPADEPIDPSAIAVSARTGEGLDRLRAVIAARLEGDGAAGTAGGASGDERKDPVGLSADGWIE